MVANKTLYSLASANQNSIYIAGLRRETLYTLRPFATKTLHTLSHSLATIDARQVLKKLAP
jgi:hypothetical protein